MAREKKDGSHVSLYMDRLIAEELTYYCKETGLPKTAAIEKAVKEMVERWKKETQKRP